eukprot:3946094-Alexandrium_andersonii.AAC.1
MCIRDSPWRGRSRRRRQPGGVPGGVAVAPPSEAARADGRIATSTSASSNSARTQVEQRRQVQETASRTSLQALAGSCSSLLLGWQEGYVPPPSDPPDKRLRHEMKL